MSFMQDNKELTISDFEKKYTMIKNHLDDNAAHDGCIVLF